MVNKCNTKIRVAEFSLTCLPDRKTVAPFSGCINLNQLQGAKYSRACDEPMRMQSEQTTERGTATAPDRACLLEHFRCLPKIIRSILCDKQIKADCRLILLWISCMPALPHKGKQWWLLTLQVSSHYRFPPHWCAASRMICNVIPLILASNTLQFWTNVTYNSSGQTTMKCWMNFAHVDLTSN